MAGDDSYANLLVDVQNERDRWFQLDRIPPLRNAVAGRPATASRGGDLGTNISQAAYLGLDLIAYHEDRVPGWWNNTYGAVQTLRASGRPVYLQEPGRYDDPPGTTADNFITAVTNAKAAGAAAWTFHTLAAKDLNGTSMQAHLVGVESDFLNRFRAYVDATSWGIGYVPVRSTNIQSWNGPYMVAENGGGGAVNADRQDAGSWETFTMHDRTDGELQDGDTVTLRTNNQLWLQAPYGGCDTVMWPTPMWAIGEGEGAWETFTILNLDRPGRVIGSGDHVAFRSANGCYAVAEGGGGWGSVVNVIRTGVGPWETWRLVVR